jgi:hypothetical protein
VRFRAFPPFPHQGGSAILIYLAGALIIGAIIWMADL